MTVIAKFFFKARSPCWAINGTSSGLIYGTRCFTGARKARLTSVWTSSVHFISSQPSERRSPSSRFSDQNSFTRFVIHSHKILKQRMTAWSWKIKFKYAYLRNVNVWHVCLFVCVPGVTTHCGCIFHSPVADFSLLVFEVSWSHTTTRHRR
jgi:hypothetical protein